MEFTSVPEDVITQNFVPLFPLNDLLRLRRVSRLLKRLVDDHIRLHVLSSKREILITSRDGYDYDEETGTYKKCISMSTLLRMEVSIPHTRFHIKFPKAKDLSNLQTVQLLNFAEKYGSQLTHLRVTSLTAPFKPGTAESELLCSMASLTHLTIDTLILSTTKYNKTRHLWPASLKDIQQIRVKTYKTPNDSKETRTFYWQLVFACSNPSMNFFTHPSYQPNGGIKSLLMGGEYYGFQAYWFTSIAEMFEACVKEEEFSSTGWKHVTKFYDFQDLHPDVIDKELHELTLPMHSCRFIVFCVENNVRLLNMPAILLESVAIPVVLIKSGGCIQSMKNFCLTCATIKLPILKKIKVETDQCALTDAGFTWRTVSAPDFENLELLEVTINSVALKDGVNTTDLFQVFFGQKMENLKTLKIKCDPPRGTEIPVPKAKSLLSACPNLTKLSITNWQGTNKAISQLWIGLPRLEEITLNSCKELGNVAFVGENKDNPTFLNLKKLKILRLECVDKMTKITDTAFHLVFRHLKLREFYLVCSTPESEIHSISEYGIKSLLTGEFAQIVERFPFEGWTLANKTNKQMKSLRDEFRVSHLL